MLTHNETFGGRVKAQDTDDYHGGDSKAGARRVKEKQDNGARGVGTSITRVPHLSRSDGAAERSGL